VSYKAALDNLLALEFFGMKLGLRNIEELLEFLGRPDRKLKTIHVAGTNGKGSVCATLAAYYQTKGLKTGLYTSPHLIDYRERIKINGEMIDEAFIESFVERVWPKVQELNATFFEVTTALAFEYFASQKVEITIIETGLGGTLDATNVLEKPLASVITSIGMDHMQQLGDKIELIASEKAGIIKRDVPAIVNVQDNVKNIFLDKAERVGAKFVDASTYELPAWAIKLSPSLKGEHQRENLRTVLVTLDVLGDLDKETIGWTLPAVAKLTGLRGRLEVDSIDWKRKQLTRIIDVGHNEAAMRRIAEFLKGRGEEVILVAGFMKDKDVAAALRLLAPFVKCFVAVEPKTKRAMASDELAAMGEAIELQTINGGGVIDGYTRALNSAKDRDTILVTGSHYLVGELLANEKSGLGVV
jgi:dihydrofolate synthase / folylpolyglutamate synthase